MALSRQLPILVEAVQYGQPGAASKRWGPSKELRKFLEAGGSGLVTCEGGIIIQSMRECRYARPGDWIVKGVDGEFRPLKPEDFEAAHEPAGIEVREG